MKTFVCPECGYKSPCSQWVKLAHCPRCGYTSSPLERKLRHQLSSSSIPPDNTEKLPTETLATMVKYVKEHFPGKIALIRQGDHLYAFGDDALTVAKVCGSDLVQLTKYSFRGVHVTGLPAILYGLRQVFIGLLVLVVGSPLALGVILAATGRVSELLP